MCEVGKEGANVVASAAANTWKLWIIIIIEHQESRLVLRLRQPLSDQLDSLLFLQLLYHLALFNVALLVMTSNALHKKAVSIQPDHCQIALMMLSRKVQTKLCFTHLSESGDGHHVLSFG